MSSIAEGTSTSNRSRQQLSGAEEDDLLLGFLIRDDWDLHEVEPSLQGGGQIVDAPVTGIGRGDDVEAGASEHDVIPFSSGIVVYFSERIEIKAS